MKYRKTYGANRCRLPTSSYQMICRKFFEKSGKLQFVVGAWIFSQITAFSGDVESAN